MIGTLNNTISLTNSLAGPASTPPATPEKILTHLTHGADQTSHSD
ncbi:hypothetical protein AB0K89_10775 [Streptomyces cinnamoneus]